MVARIALVSALAELSGEHWSAEIEHDWKAAITLISVTMLQGAAVETAVFAERLTDQD